MKGRQILIAPLSSGGDVAILMVDGRIDDIFADRPADTVPQPEAVYYCRALRPMKGLGAVMVDLGHGQHGFLRQKPGTIPKGGGLVQVTGWNEPGKAPPVTSRLSLRRATAVLTPDAPGVNVSRSIRDPEVRGALEALATGALRGVEETTGLIVRSAAEFSHADDIAGDIRDLMDDWNTIRQRMAGADCGCLLAAPSAAMVARRDWFGPETPIRQGAGILQDAGILDDMDRLADPRVEVGEGFVMIEPTSALVAVDVNTGADLSPAAGLKANLAAVRELPRQLRLRGLGGQITVDFAPMQHSGRSTVEQTLKSALRRDPIETGVVGWTPLGHLELNRKRARAPVDWAALLAEVQ